MSHQRAGDEGKPSIHIGRSDVKLAKKLDIEDDSPSTVYSESLRMRKNYEKIREKEMKEARKKIIEICNEMDEKFNVDRTEIIGDLL